MSIALPTESDLIAFFSTEPVPQPAGEEGLFAGPLFEKLVDDLALTFSLSESLRDLIIDLARADGSGALLHYHLRNVSAAEIERDPAGRVWFRAHGDGQRVALAVEPQIEMAFEPAAT